MEINTQLYIENQTIILQDDHLLNIQNNIDVWENFKNIPNIAQKKLIQTTSILKLENIQSFSLNIKIPSTYFAGVEENYFISFNNNTTLSKEVFKSNLENSDNNLDFSNFHRISSIYNMSHVMQVIFNSLKEKLTKTSIESIEILTSLIVFEMENLSKCRHSNTLISQEMFSLENPLNKWVSEINIITEFNDYKVTQNPKHYH